MADIRHIGTLIGFGCYREDGSYDLGEFMDVLFNKDTGEIFTRIYDEAKKAFVNKVYGKAADIPEAEAFMDREYEWLFELD